MRRAAALMALGILLSASTLQATKHQMLKGVLGPSVVAKLTMFAIDR